MNKPHRTNLGAGSYPRWISRINNQWYAITAGLTAFTLIVGMWFYFEQREDKHASHVTGATARAIESLVRQDLGTRTAILAELAKKWSVKGKSPSQELEADTSYLVTTKLRYREVQWIDADYSVRWSLTADKDNAGSGFNLQNDPKTFAAAQATRSMPMETVTTSIFVTQHEPSLVIYTPVHNDLAGNGLLVAVLQIDEWLNKLLKTVLTQRHGASIEVNDEFIYAQLNEQNTYSEQKVSSEEFELYNQRWRVETYFDSEFRALSRNHFGIFLLSAGALFALLVALVVLSTLTARGRAAELRYTAQRLETLLDNLPGAAYRINQSNIVTFEFVGEGCKKITGYSRQDFEMGKISWREIVHPDDYARVRVETEHAIEAGKYYDFEYRIINRQGEGRCVSERGQVIASSTGDGVVREGIVSDITERKLAQDKVLEMQEYYTAVVETAVEAIITISVDGSIETFNRAAEEMFGYAFDEVKLKNVDVLMPQPYHSEHNAYIKHYLDTNEPRVIGIGREVVALRKDGTEFPIHLSVGEISNLDERKFVGLIRDISAQRTAELEASQHREELAHVDRVNMLGEMATGIAHEINQPLTAISLFSQAAKRLLESGQAERLPEILDKLSLHSKRAGDVIERMQSMARKHDSVREGSDLNTIIKEITTLAEVEARHRDISLELDLDKSLPQVDIDRVQIQQVVLNLLRNGMEAMRQVDCRHGNKIKLQTRLMSNDDAEILIIDTGTGVSDEVSEVIFAPFSTTKGAGMGLGLSICQAIITAHGGQIGFSNNELHGATFYLRLPTSIRDGKNG